ncbi:hypothetical protein M514_07239 [Trichuris suis]|uniref:Uncharacterized protein n=1 Tax=Trichuris suis TaxID=68888 RepID=A0A085N1G4_9BILA|nr:hypothetical protein M513_07239 [Trichuris suis]KFD63310.1 hypothetical protein M514_07239 [Trichuris suis]
MDEGDLEEWMDVDNAFATGRHYSDSEIVQMVVCQDKKDSGEERCCDENEEDTGERISIDRLIKITSELLKGLEQRSSITEQEIMNIYMLQEKLIRERPKYMKQLISTDMFKKWLNSQVMKQLAFENPVPSTSAHPDIPPLSPRVYDL